ncbi:MAG: hypothetical protein M1823_000841 [Watsoniomyces obsoletus]|nr:MAG: hypothetical protein M1823_000841 [Watsoniomyces obsoletus]
MSSPKQVYVAVIGVGGVGRCFLSQLSTLSTRLSQSSSKPIHLLPILLSRSTKALYTEDFRPLSLETWQRDLDASTQDPIPLDQLVEHLSRCPGPVILADNTSSQEVANTYPALLQRGIHIVTPNKKGFSGSYKLWQEIFTGDTTTTTRGYIFHESTVGAGLPIISTLTELLATGDTISRIEGVFSGTMSFLFNNFAPINSAPIASGGEGGGGSTPKFSEEVIKAQKLGYTEPDPREDLNGQDVARKLTILARIAGLHIESPTNSFPVQSLIPKPLEDTKSGEEFLEKLHEYDEEIGELKKEAEKEGKVIRYVGSIDMETKSVKVGLEKFDSTHPIATLKGSDNIVGFYTGRYKDNPLIIQGAGAGGEVTAMGVTGDLIKVLNRLH